MSSKATWPSKYSPKKTITANQYILEIVCEANARRQGKDLPLQFWKLEEWRKEYLSQTRAVSKLLKKYSAKAIISVIRSKNIWSLRPKWVENVVRLEQEKMDAVEAAAKVCANKDGEQEIKLENPVKSRSRRSKIDKLMEIDDI